MKKIIVGILAFAVWIVVNFCFSLLVGGYAADMTATHIYTLDKASEAIAEQIETPLTFRLFISDRLSSYNQDSYNYASFVTAVLGRYQKLNPQNIRLEIIRVKSWSDEAELAEEAGIKAIPYNDGYIYFGLEVTDGSHRQHIAELISGRKAYFENDINRIIRRFTEKNAVSIGIVSPEIPLFADGKKHKIWSLVDELSADYKLHNISEKAPYIPLDIKLLIVLNPTKLPPLFVYALDQYLMRGGKLVIFVDPYSEITHFYRGYPPQSRTAVQQLLKEWGVLYDNNRVIGSFGSSLKISGDLRYPFWFFTDGNGYKRLHFRTAGALDIAPKEGLNYEVLVSSPADAGEIKMSLLRFASKKSAAEHFKGEDRQYNLVLKVSGKFVSAYPQGYFDNTKHETDIPPFAFIAHDGAELAVIADSDFMSDDAWALSSDEQNPVYGAEPYADNAEFILKLVDDMLFSGKDGYIASAYPKYADTSNVVQHIAEPLIAASERQLDKLNAECNNIQREIRKIKELLFDADAGTGLQYRRQIGELEKQQEECSKRINRLTMMLNHQAETEVNRLLWLTILVYPLALLLFIAGFCFLLRHANLKRCK